MFDSTPRIIIAYHVPSYFEICKSNSEFFLRTVDFPSKILKT